MDKVTGIGGVFIKAKDPKALAKWYQENLGINFGENLYTTFKWTNENNPAVPGPSAKPAGNRPRPMRAVPTPSESIRGSNDSRSARSATMRGLRRIRAPGWISGLPSRSAPRLRRERARRAHISKILH